MTAKTKRVAAYGSLYMDEGERWPKALEQLIAFRDMKGPDTAVHVYFDVMGNEEHRELGRRIVDRVFEYAERNFPDGKHRVSFSEPGAKQ